MHVLLATPPPAPTTLTVADTLAFVLADLAIILAAARLVGTAFARLGQPRIVGEIVAGILIGPTVLGGTLDIAAAPAMNGLPMRPALAGTGLTHQLYPLGAFSFLNLLGQIALVFYMFLVGIELDQRLLKGRGSQIMTMALAVVAVPVALGFAFAAGFNDSTLRPPGVSITTYALFIGAGLSVTAFPVMARILQEKGLIATEMGAVGVGGAAVVTVLMFLVIALANATGAANGELGAGVVGGVGVRLLLALALIAVLLLLVRPFMSWVLRDYSRTRPLDGNHLALMLILALATGLAADRIGINALVGGFLFGAAVPAKPGLAEAVVERLSDAVILFFLPVFLAVSGLGTDLRLITGSLVLPLLVFLVLMVLGKWGVGYAAGRLVGLRGHQANTLGVLFNCRGLLILVVAKIGSDIGALTGQTKVIFVLGAIVTTLMTGPLVDLFAKREKVPADADRRTSGVATLTA